MAIIEFLGLPASGKSTLASALEEGVAAAGFPVLSPPASRVKRLAAKAEAVVTYRRAFGIALRALAVDGRPLGQRWVAARWLMTTFAAHLLAGRSDEPHVLVQSEGCAQRALLVFLDAGSLRINPGLTEYLRRCPTPDVLVIVEADVATSVERQIERRASTSVARCADRFDTPEPQLADVIAMAEDLLSRAASEIGNQIGVEVVRIDAGDLDHAAMGLSDHVVRLLEARTRMGDDTT